MKVNELYLSAKQSPEVKPVIYLVEMFNEKVVCLSSIGNGGVRTYSLVKREGFEEEFKPTNVSIPELPKQPKYNVFELELASIPLIKWLNQNCNPHMKVIVECDRVELVSGECSFKNDHYIKD